jgi:Pyruvate/2-oxoacid:ferredoxin oxidoreductase gamma subunit
MATTTDPVAREQLTDEDQKFRESQPLAQQKAQDLETQRDAELAHSKKRMTERDIAQYAGMATQLAIAIASVAALTRRFDVFIIGALVGLLGVGITAYAIYLHMTVPA